MTWALLLTAILTSAADSLNPIAITQQFVLQGLVKKPRHIWFYIVPTGAVNLAGGFLAYYGLAALIGGVLRDFLGRHSRTLSLLELILGAACLSTTAFLIQNRKLDELRRRVWRLESGDEAPPEAGPRIRSVSPLALTALGAGATLSELTTALPYFAFLAVLLQYQLPLYQAALILVLYNLIYTSPLILLYVIYRKAQSRFHALYRFLKGQIEKWSAVLAPLLAALAGAALIFHSMSALLRALPG